MNILKTNSNFRFAVFFCFASVAFSCSAPPAEEAPGSGGHGGNGGQAGQSSGLAGSDERNGSAPAAAGMGGQISRDAGVAPTPDVGAMQMETPDAQTPDAQKTDASPEVKGPKWVDKGTRLEPVYWQDELRAVRVLKGFKDTKSAVFCSISSLTSKSSDHRCSGVQKQQDDMVFTFQAEDAPGDIDLMMATATDGTKFAAWPLVGGTSCFYLTDSKGGLDCKAQFPQPGSAPRKTITMTGSELQIDVATVGDWLLSPSVFAPRDLKRQQPCSLVDVGESRVCLPGIYPPVWEWKWMDEYFGDTCDPSNRIWSQGKPTETAPPRVYVIDNNVVQIFSPGDFVQGMGTSSFAADCIVTYPVKGWLLRNKLPDESFPTLR